MEHFTPFASTLGGLLIGLSAAMLLLFNGKIAGISGILGRIVAPDAGGDVGWRVAFLAGLVAGGGAMYFASPPLFEVAVERSWMAVAAAGLLVGFGTRLGSGCTSGHGVCGIGRASPRSLVSVLTFVAVGALVVFLVRTVLGGSL
jgi:hypothetical protein